MSPQRAKAATQRQQGAGNRCGSPSKEEKAEQKFRSSGLFGRAAVYFKMLGPGLITGASDDDPSGIGTYIQAGAQFGLGQLWTALFSFPLIAGIQEICGRVAMQTGHSLTEVIREHYSRPVLYFCVSVLLIANTVNLGADLGGMAAACQLLLGLPFVVWLLLITTVTVLLQVFMEYKKYAQVLRFLTLSLLSYALVFFVTPGAWRQLLERTLIPSLQLNRDYLLSLVAILGTTISPYLFFWQTNLIVEEKIADGKLTTADSSETTAETSETTAETSETTADSSAAAACPEASRVELKWMRTDVLSGMFLSNLIMWFIIATAAGTLFTHGERKVDSALQAAKMLEPIAGSFASALFATGIVGTGLLAIPVFAGSAAYAIAETFKMRKGLYLKMRQAPGFYAIIILSTTIGFLINLCGIDPIKALYYAAVLNGIIAPPLLVMIMLISGNRQIMKDKINTRLSSFLGWFTTAAMTCAALALLVSFWG
jgi:NRAMP (natural resistance-associated macrophage protein)-like metal ion transporter